jgi:phosphonate dehydrogenase
MAAAGDNGCMRRKQIVVTQRIFPETAALLAAEGEVIANPGPEPWPDAELRMHTAEADALMVFMPDWIDDAFLAGCPHLKIIAATLKGYDNFDVEACTRRGVWFTIVPDLLTEPTAELALALMLAVARNVIPGDQHVRSGAFRGWRPALYGTTLFGATVGIIGFGAVGRALAGLLEPFRTRIITFDIVDTPKALEHLLRESQYVVPLLPLTSDTLHMLNRDRIAIMRSGAFLINVGRGSVVDEDAVGHALASGHLAGYAADTFEMEDWARPGRPDRVPATLLESEHAVFTPHLGSAVRGARQEIERLAATSICQALRGETPGHAVNVVRIAPDAR